MSQSKSSNTATPTANAIAAALHSAETSILATLIDEFPATLPPVISLLIANAPESFSDLRHGQAALAIRELLRREQQVNLVTVIGWLKKNLPDFENPRQFVLGIKDEKTVLDLAEADAAPIWDKFRLRRVGSVGDELLKAIQQAPQLADDIIDRATRALSTITADSLTEAEHNGELARHLCEFMRPPQDDPSELLRHRFLCRGGGLLFNGPTGIGKSSFEIQCAILWALNREAFGIVPARTIKSMIVQAENDDGDVAEMRDGVIAGLGLSADEIQSASNNIIVCRENTVTGHAFIGWLRKLLAQHHPDLLWIDPAFSYVGGNASAQDVVGPFLRNMLGPALSEFNCGCIIVHHTNKPATGKEKNQWSAGDFAYTGSGSIEWANWARAVLALRSLGSHDTFQLMASKRGVRLRWKDEEGNRTVIRHISHASEPGVICWRDSDETDMASIGRPKTIDNDEVFGLLPPEGLLSQDWVRLAKSECGISERSLHRARKLLVDQGRVHRSPISDKWQPIIKK